MSDADTLDVGDVHVEVPQDSSKTKLPADQRRVSDDWEVEKRVYRIFKSLAIKFGFQKDNMHNQTQHYLHLYHSRVSRMGREDAMASIHSELVGDQSNYFSWSRSVKVNRWKEFESPAEACLLDVPDVDPKTPTESPVPSGKKKGGRGHALHKQDSGQSVSFADGNAQGERRRSSLLASINLGSLAMSDISKDLKGHTRNRSNTYYRKRVVITTSSEAEKALLEVALYLMIWGEAANIRLVPEGLCFIFKLAKNYDGKAMPSGHFLNNVIKPIYEFIFAEGYSKDKSGKMIDRKRAHTKKLNYDDMNETFWDFTAIRDIVVPAPDGQYVPLLRVELSKQYSYLSRVDWKRSFKKTFLEVRTPLHLMVNFNRLWIFQLVFYIMSLAFQRGNILRKGIFAYAGFLSLVFQITANFLEMGFLPSWKWGPLPTFTLWYIILGVIYLVFLVPQQACYIANDSNAASCFMSLDAFGIVLIVLSVVAVVTIFLFSSQRHWWTDDTVFTYYYPFHKGSEQVMSYTTWVIIFSLKIVLGYILIYSRLFSSAADMWIVSRSDFMLCDDLSLCEAGFKIFSSFLVFVGCFMYLMDVQIYYIVVTSAVGIIKGFALKVYSFSTWGSLFRRLPENSKKMCFANANPQLKSKFPILWNDFIDDMYERHQIGDAELKQFKFLSKNTNGEIDYFPVIDKDTNLLQPSFFTNRKLPKNSEAKRRIKFFSQSLAMKMPRATNIASMRSFTCITPHYAEPIIYSEEQMLGDDSGPFNTLLEYLKAMHPVEWDFFCSSQADLVRERTGDCTTEEWENIQKVGFSSEGQKHEIMQSRLWASSRAQTVFRTVRGMMLYEKALKRLVLMESPELFQDFKIKSERDEAIDKYIRSKYQYLVAMQRYDVFTDEEVEGAEVLLNKWPNINIAYIAHDPETKKYYSCLTSGRQPVLPNGKRKPLFSVELPGNPILGDGKSDNQNTCIHYARGEIIQAIDANQDHYLEECFKIRNLMEEFNYDHTWDKPVAIVGTREHIYSIKVGPFADLAAFKELIFGTLVQRTLASPHGMRLHYGHPDYINKMFILSRGGMSKATKGINLSEDIYLGMVSYMRGGRIKHTEYSQCGKGRDMGFMQILGFIKKVARGAGEIVLCREQYRLGINLPFNQLCTFYYANAGHQAVATLTMTCTLLLLILVFGIAVFKRLPPTGQNSAQALHEVEDFVENFLYYVITTVFIPFIPLLTQICFEDGFLMGFFVLGRQILSFMPLFDIFSMQYQANQHLDNLKFGGANYVSTGRGIAIHRVPFHKTYTVFARSNIHLGVLLTLLVVYGLIELKWPYLSFMVIVAFATYFSPFLFNPHQFNGYKAFAVEYTSFLQWLFRYKPGGESWYSMTQVNRYKVTGLYHGDKTPEGQVRLARTKNGKRVYDCLPMKIGLSFERDLLWPSIILVVVIFINSFFYNTNDTIASHGIFDHQNIPRFIYTILFPLGASMVVLFLRQIFYACFSFNRAKGEDWEPTGYSNVVITTMSIGFFLYSFKEWECDFQTAIRCIITGIFFYLLLFKFIHNLLPPELPYMIAHHHFVQGRMGDMGRVLEGFSTGARIGYTLREFVCKVVEAIQFLGDFIIAHIIFAHILFLSLIPFFDRIHSALLFWSSPFQSRMQKRVLSSIQRKSVIVCTIIWCVIAAIIIAVTLLLIYVD